MKKMLILILTAAIMLSSNLVIASAEGAAGFKLGLDINTKISSSKDAGDADGLAQVDSDVVAVLVDADGKIVDAYIDAVQTKMPFTVEGKLGANFPSEPKTKIELGNDYGMSAVSKIGDWDRQIAAFRAYIIGKTVGEVQGIAVDDATKPTGADLTASCTMSVGDYISGVVAAMGKATACSAAAGDKLGLAILTETDGSKDAMDGADGLCQAYSDYAVVTVNTQGAVTACLLDSTKGNVNFSTAGKITSDLTARTSTLQELGDGYGMKAASPIGKEWFEQANALAAYAVGKTADEIGAIALDQSGKATDADLVASVTISLGTLKPVLLKAVQNAQ